MMAVGDNDYPSLEDAGQHLISANVCRAAQLQSQSVNWGRRLATSASRRPAVC